MTVFKALTARFGDQFTRNETVRAQHGHTRTALGNQPPEAVVFAEARQDVVDLVRICASHKTPIIPFGTGTSLEGHINAPHGGISLDLSRMDQILAIHPEDMDVTLQPGVTRKRLNEELRATGLFFPIDPGADASLGGMASTRASGTNAVRYGTMKDNVLALEVVTASGEVIRTGTRARKSSAGYDLTRLMVGSEGTLGIITELTLKLYGQPEQISAGVVTFPSLEAACQAVITTIQSAIPVARIELLDPLQIRASNMYSKLSMPEQPTLFVEFHGTSASVAEQAELFEAIAQDHDGSAFTSATKPEDRTRLWQARHDAYWAALGLKPGASVTATDVCVPISNLAACVAQTQAKIAAYGLLAPIVGHVGDGNFHVQLLTDTSDLDEVRRSEDFMSDLAHLALSFGGTCTGEHGIGQGKMKYMDKEHGPALGWMRAIKQALDPNYILNPGKIFNI